MSSIGLTVTSTFSSSDEVSDYVSLDDSKSTPFTSSSLSASASINFDWINCNGSD